MIVEKLECKIYNKDDVSKWMSQLSLIIVMRKGDEGDCMYILYQGEVGVYVSEDKCVAILKDSKVFGERALETDEKRGATILAHTETTCLVLTKKDFVEIIYVCINLLYSYSISS